MLKADLHLHTADDPMDAVMYTAEELIDRAAELGHDVLAITLHGKRLDRPEVFEYARDKGILLLPGIEKYVSGKEVLLYNVSVEEVEGTLGFDDLARLRKEKGPDFMTIAPHPFYPRENCINEKLEEHIDLIDGIEYCHFYTSFINHNKPSEALSEKYNKPLIANSDLHCLHFFGRNYTLLDTDDKTPEGVARAIRENKTKAIHSPHSIFSLFSYMVFMVIHETRRLLKRFGLIKMKKSRLSAPLNKV